MHTTNSPQNLHIAFGTPTVDYPWGRDVHKYTSAKERAVKNQKMTVRHYGFMEKVYGLLFSATPQQHNTVHNSIDNSVVGLLLTVHIQAASTSIF